jgi:hypothetical protein
MIDGWKIGRQAVSALLLQREQAVSPRHPNLHHDTGARQMEFAAVE